MAAAHKTTLWIEAGAMSGGARNQLELPNDLAEFFDDRSRTTEIVRLRLPSGDIYDRPLTYRGTDYGQWTQIWRLGLPTADMGGPEYAGRVVRFERITIEGTPAYNLTVTDLGSHESNEWERRSVEQGTTAGASGRRYGWW